MNFFLSRISIVVGVVVSLMMESGCRPSETSNESTAKRGYAIRGEVISLVPQRSSIVVHHEEIPGYMPSMAMEFVVGPAELNSLKVGQTISASMTEVAPGEFHLERVRVVDKAKDQEVAEAARVLKEDTVIRGKYPYREIGENVPTFSLYNQDGEVVSTDSFRGKRVILNFIYTRCPVATMCPASTAKMMMIQARSIERGIKNLELVSISLDPEFDTPSVLKEYARIRSIDTKHFSFLSGPAGAVRDLLVNFGVVVKPQDNVLSHTLSTLLINESGVIIYREDGPGWTPEGFLDRL